MKTHENAREWELAENLNATELQTRLDVLSVIPIFARPILSGGQLGPSSISAAEVFDERHSNFYATVSCVSAVQ